MKSPVNILTLLLFFSAINSSLAQTYEDDIYYSPTKDRKLTIPQTDQTSNNNSSVSSEKSMEWSDNQNNNNNRNSDFNYDDYYDDAYTARIRRFHRPITTYSYYDPYYTNSYWYNYNPAFYGTSIYLGYNFWGPSYYNPYAWSWGYYNPYIYNGWGWGGSYSLGYGGYYSPWGWNNCWGWNYGWGGNPWHFNNYNAGFMNGYHQGYQNGYFNSMNNNNPYYYNSFDNTSQTNFTFGPRGSGVRGGERYAAGQQKPFQQKMNEAIAIDRGNMNSTNINAPGGTSGPRPNIYNSPTRPTENMNNPNLNLPRSTPANQPIRPRNTNEGNPRNVPTENPRQLQPRGNQEINMPQQSNPRPNPNIQSNPKRGNQEMNPRQSSHWNSSGNTNPAGSFGGGIKSESRSPGSTGGNRGSGSSGSSSPKRR